MVYSFFVVLSAETASFRDPGGQLYHATLPLPPVSTLVGIAGAALGFDFERVWTLFKKHDITVGVCYDHAALGKGLDLWKYRKIVSAEVRGDIVKREFWFRPSYRIYYACTEKNVLHAIQQAFADPAWALSLGTSDDIVLIQTVSNILTAEHRADETILSQCLVSGNQMGHYSFDWESISKSAITLSLSLPVVKNLPIDFSFTHGERRGSQYRPFTFLAGAQQLKSSTNNYLIGEQPVHLISLIQE